MRKRNKKIKKLKSDLEIERFEKADLHEELREYKNQINRLESQLKEKSTDISKLQREFYALDNRSPPHFDKNPIFDIEKKYKSQIQSLELYCEQLQTKQDGLQQESLDLSDKLNISLEELKIWQQTSRSLEKNNKDLTDRCAQQTIELDNLNLQCAELTAILDEMKSNNDGNDSSIMFSPLRAKRQSMNDKSYEDLAHTIIDVQLKDAQKEITELKIFLKESTERGNSLEVELNNMKISYEELFKNFTDLENSRKNLLEKVEDLEKTKQLLEENNLKVKDDLQQKIQQANNEIKTIKNELSDVENYRKSLQEEIENLKLEKYISISEKECLLVDIRKLDSQLKSNSEKLKQVQNKNSEKDIIISENSNILAKIKCNLECQEHENESLHQKIEELNTAASSYKTS